MKKQLILAMTGPIGTAAATVEQTEDSKVNLRPDTENYVKSTSASGSQTLHNGDPVATGLAGMLLSETFAVAAILLGSTVEELEGKYAKLNLGMQRMNLGNRIRGAISKLDEGNAKEVKAAERKNTQIEARNAKAIEKAKAAHAKIKTPEGEEPAVFDPETISVEVLATVPELNVGEGLGVKAFEEAITPFVGLIQERDEAAVKAKAEKEAAKKEAAEAKAAEKAEKAKAAAAKKAEKEADSEEDAE